MPDKIPKPLQDFLDEVNKGKSSYTPVDVRMQSEKVAAIFALPKLELPFIINRFFHYSDHLIPVRIYHPKPEISLPVILHFHGGGHVAGSLETHDAICRRIAKSSECIVIAVDYRLAPEFPYPAGLEDCFAAFEERAKILKDIHADVNQVFLMGDSAGGNLALSVCHKAKKKGDQQIQGLALIYPSVDFAMQYDSIHRNGQGYLLTQEKIKWYFEHYFAKGGDRIKASPINFDHLELLPPIYIAVAEYDPLYDEGLAFAEKVKNLNVPITLENFKGMIHAFAQLEKLVPEQVMQLVDSTGSFIKRQRAKTIL
ncbi:alpha/beta hydrolase [Legionella israelensis]|uniref:alpha/beta hydrolase n=1 Tax=Legionella israelensis TaxID=454 RepID=UPI001FD11FC9|nr:alpha/beta hydrolase [Legionella israelensis]